MSFTEGDIDGLVIKPAAKHEDPRGWLAELFRAEELHASLVPAMAYMSLTHPGESRGPHEHMQQTDMFVFFGPGCFMVKCWDNRKASPTYGNFTTLMAGEENPVMLIVPPGVVHAFRNLSEVDGLMINLPNRQFNRNPEQRHSDEIRYETVKNSPYRI
jgi:dTDP-4-dehydrorhamnose 3,5-epimerase